MVELRLEPLVWGDHGDIWLGSHSPKCQCPEAPCPFLHSSKAWDVMTQSGSGLVSACFPVATVSLSSKTPGPVACSPHSLGLRVHGQYFSPDDKLPPGLSPMGMQACEFMKGLSQWTQHGVGSGPLGLSPQGRYQRTGLPTMRLLSVPPLWLWWGWGCCVCADKRVPREEARPSQSCRGLM